MKILNLIVFLAIVVLLTNCEKDNKNNTTQEDLSKYEIFDIHVQKLSDKSPMCNYDLCFFKRTWHQSGRSYIELIIDSNKTNINGDASFKIPQKLILDSNHIFYYISSSLYDSSYNGRYGGV